MGSKDVIGEAILSFYEYNDPTDIVVESNIVEKDIIPIKYLFRSFIDMPELEQIALDLCKGEVLDVGAAAGCHSIELVNKNLNVTPIDLSKSAVKVMKGRGLKAVNTNFYNVKQKFDTLLFLMNGIGISGTLAELPRFLNHAKSLLKDNGQILLHSSDISYLFIEKDGTLTINLNSNYYGEIKYKMRYKDNETDWFNWLFIDFDLLTEYANKCGLKCELIKKGEHYDYLARLTCS